MTLPDKGFADTKVRVCLNCVKVMKAAQGPAVYVALDSVRLSLRCVMFLASCFQNHDIREKKEVVPFRRKNAAKRILGG